MANIQFQNSVSIQADSPLLTGQAALYMNSGCQPLTALVFVFDALNIDRQE